MNCCSLTHLMRCSSSWLEGSFRIDESKTVLWFYKTIQKVKTTFRDFGNLIHNQLMPSYFYAFKVRGWLLVRSSLFKRWECREPRIAAIDLSHWVQEHSKDSSIIHLLSCFQKTGCRVYSFVALLHCLAFILNDTVLGGRFSLRSLVPLYSFTKVCETNKTKIHLLRHFRDLIGSDTMRAKF